MSNRKNDNDRLPWQQFRTRDPNIQSVFPVSLRCGPPCWVRLIAL